MSYLDAAKMNLFPRLSDHTIATLACKLFCQFYKQIINDEASPFTLLISYLH